MWRDRIQRPFICSTDDDVEEIEADYERNSFLCCRCNYISTEHRNAPLDSLHSNVGVFKFKFLCEPPLAFVVFFFSLLRRKVVFDTPTRSSYILYILFFSVLPIPKHSWPFLHYVSMHAVQQIVKRIVS
eukprot:gene7687-5392_t